MPAVEPGVELLITGFRPFDGREENPSEWLARQLPDRLAAEGIRASAAILDVVYARAAEQLAAALRQFRPRAALLFGLAYATDSIRLERVAINLDDAAGPDEAGERREGRVIRPRGPAAYWSGLPLQQMAEALGLAEIPVSFSSSAGGFLCNHVFYEACWRSKRGGFRAGFVHLPPFPHQLAGAAGRRGMDPESLLKAGLICARVAAQP
jgi:pyroglutamyl-peptidase